MEQKEVVENAYAVLLVFEDIQKCSIVDPKRLASYFAKLLDCKSPGLSAHIELHFMEKQMGPVARTLAGSKILRVVFKEMESRNGANKRL